MRQLVEGHGTRVLYQCINYKEDALAYPEGDEVRLVLPWGVEYLTPEEFREYCDMV